MKYFLKTTKMSDKSETVEDLNFKSKLDLYEFWDMFLHVDRKASCGFFAQSHNYEFQYEVIDSNGKVPNYERSEISTLIQELRVAQ